MNSEIFLYILSVLLGLNLFFLKDLLKRLMNIELALARISTRNIQTEKMLDKHDEEMDEFRHKLSAMENSLSAATEYIKTKGGYNGR